MFGMEQLRISASEINKATPSNSLTVNFKDGIYSRKSCTKSEMCSRDIDACNAGGANTLCEAIVSRPYPSASCDRISGGSHSDSLLDDVTERLVANSNNSSMFQYRNVQEIPSSESLSLSCDSVSSSASVLDDSSNETMYVWEQIEDLSERVGKMSVVDERKQSDASSGIDSEQEYIWDLIDTCNQPKTCSKPVISVMKMRTTSAIRQPIGPGTSQEKIMEIEATQPNGKFSAMSRRRMFRFYAEAMMTTTPDVVEGMYSCLLKKLAPTEYR